VEEALRGLQEPEAPLRQRRQEPIQEQVSLQPKAQARMAARRQAVELRPQAQPKQELTGRRLQVLQRSEAAKPPQQEERRQREDAPGQRQPQADEQ